MSGRLNSSFFRRFDRYDSETGKRSAASSAFLLQYSAKKSPRAIYKRPPRERSHLCDVFLPTIRRVLPNEGGSNVQAAAVLVALSVPVYAAGDFPMAPMQTTLPREAVTVTDWYKQNVYDPNENKDRRH
jgi:hypothetical protein